MNKRGGDNWIAGNWGWIAFIVIFIILYAMTNGGFGSEDLGKSFTDAMKVNSKGFEEAGVLSDTGAGGFVFLNYIFGKVPGYLIDLTSGFSAAIIVIGVWLIFVLIFGDIIDLFGMFSTSTSKLVGLVLTIIVANIQLIKAIVIISLAITAFLGSLAVVASILFIFGLFVAFHFGTYGLRKKIIMRKAEDAALKAVAGGKKLASGASVLAEVAKEDKKAEKTVK
ncbi:MAG: hypothetical protein ABIH92_00160 [Nanoarchaeota archaeon]